MEHKFDLNDVLITPAVISDISSRSEVDCYYYINGKQHLPIMVSPMDTVIDETNYKEFLDNKMPICLPRGTNLTLVDYKDLFDEDNMIFESLSLQDMRQRIDDDQFITEYVLIDIANGNLSILLDICKEFKTKYPIKKLMVGNIANPLTYVRLSEVGVDYIRCSIGSGSGCTTSVHTGIGYPMGSLINEINVERKKLIKSNKPNSMIVGDGGFREYSDIIKGLALGCDYIMIGSALNKAVESCGQSYFMGIKVSNSISRILFKFGFKVGKKYRGMSTKEVQRKWNKINLRSSEGVVRFRSVEYDLKGWKRNLEDYLKSTMSYCSKRNLKDFIGNVDWVLITNNSFNRYIK